LELTFTAMKKTFIAIASILAIVAGCAKTNIQPKAVKATVQVSMEEAQTRATLNAETRYQNFETTDRLAIYDGESAKCFTLASGEGTKNAVFTSTTPLESAEKYYAVYPYGSNITGSGNVIDMAFYSSYINYDEAIGKAEGGNNIMAAISTDGTFSLKNVCSYILFDIQSYATDHLVKSIVISDPDDNYIAGWATLTFDDSGDVAVAIKTEAEYSAEKTITINCGYSGVSTTTLKPFIIAVPPVFSNGFNMTVNFTEGDPLVLSTSTPVGRNEIVTMPAIEFDAPEVVEVNGKKYSSIYKGIRAANATTSDVTVKLLTDITDIQDSVVVDNAAEKLTTLDLNGHTLSCLTEGVNKTVSALTDLTVCDNSVEGTGKVVGLHSAITAEQGKLTINSGSFEADGYTKSNTAVIYSYGGKSKLTINGGTITCIESDNAGRTVNVTNAGEINGGSIICNCATGFALRVYSTIELPVDGENVVIYSKSTSNAAIYSGAGTAIVNVQKGYVYSEKTDIQSNITRVLISGGHFNKKVTAIAGYECKSSTVTGPDGRTYDYQVAELTDPVASIDSKSYFTMAEAIADANASTAACTLKLLKDVTADSVTFINTNLVTLDLNRKAMAASICVKGTGVKFKITDSSAEKDGKVTRTGKRSTVNVIDGAEFTLEAGELAGPTSSGGDYTTVRVRANSKFTMNGGYTKAKTEAGAVRVDGGEAIINGGIIEAYDKYGRCFNARSGAKITINGGEFQATDCVVRTYDAGTAEIDIKGGIFKTIQNTVSGGANHGIIWLDKKANKVNISGGYFGVFSADVIVNGTGGYNSSSITGGTFGKDASGKIPASAGYKWQELTTPDTTTIPGYTLTHAVVAEE